MMKKNDYEMHVAYMDFVFESILNRITPEEERILLRYLEPRPDVEAILNELFLYASEFSGNGYIDHKVGDETSDSIPCRLSHGEFVLSSKATAQLGASTLYKMMRDAEAKYDKLDKA